MSQPQTEKVRKVSPFLIGIILAAIIGTIVVSLVPQFSKPLFMQYYRALYKAEMVRPME